MKKRTAHADLCHHFYCLVTHFSWFWLKTLERPKSKVLFIYLFSFSRSRLMSSMEDLLFLHHHRRQRDDPPPPVYLCESTAPSHFPWIVTQSSNTTHSLPCGSVVFMEKQVRFFFFGREIGAHNRKAECNQLGCRFKFKVSIDLM